MAERLDYIRVAPRLLLDVGSGTGYGLELLRQRYPAARLLALDIARPMLARARVALPWWRRLLAPRGQGWLCADLEKLPLADASVDMIWSNLALQWANDLPATLAGFARVLRPGGLLMFTTFGPDTLKELRAAFAGVDGHGHVSPFTDMHDIGDMLHAAGMADVVIDMEMIRLTYRELKPLLLELKAIGAHNATATRPRGLMGKGEWRRLNAAYESFRSDGRLPATYEVIYGHAWKPLAPCAPAGGPQPLRFMARPR